MFDERATVCKPFKKHHDDQLKLVSSLDWVNFGALSDVKDLIVKTLSAENAKAYIDDSRIEMITYLTSRRIKNLETLAKTNDRVQTIDTVDEVEHNIAADYGPKLSM